MKKILLILLVACASCTNLQNICFTGKPERLSGEVLYAVPKSNYNRTVVLIINNKKVVIYGVPNKQVLYNIPVCKYHGRYYWVMP
jgi:hypothetical protein